MVLQHQEKVLCFDCLVSSWEKKVGELWRLNKNCSKQFVHQPPCNQQTRRVKHNSILEGPKDDLKIPFD